MEYPSVSQQIANLLRVGRSAQESGLTEVARIQAELIAQLAREYIYQEKEQTNGNGKNHSHPRAR